jgi:anti-sigma factor RsiW
MTCREFVDFIAAYRDGELDEEVALEFDRHLGKCKRCLDYLRDYGDVIALAKGAYADPELDVPEEAPEELVEAVMAALRREKN